LFFFFFLFFCWSKGLDSKSVFELARIALMDCDSEEEGLVQPGDFGDPGPLDIMPLEFAQALPPVATPQIFTDCWYGADPASPQS
jgi:hypothetical protein